MNGLQTMLKTTRRTGGYRTRFGLHKLMMLPAAALFLVFFMVPFLQGIYMAFTNWNGFARMDFVGLDNFIYFFQDDRAVTAVTNTLFYGVACTLLLNVVGMLYALLLDADLKGLGAIRTFLYFPTIISPIIMGYIWKFILSSENGVIMDTLGKLNMMWLYQDWLGDPKQALIVIVLVHTWQNVGGTMIIYLAGLQSIDEQMLESARLDGANAFQLLWRIKLPLLAAALRINIITTIIGSMSIFDIIVSLTNGGPGFYTESLSQFIYRQSTSGLAGYSAAVALILFVIILIPVTLAFVAMRRMYVEN